MLPLSFKFFFTFWGSFWLWIFTIISLIEQISRALICPRDFLLSLPSISQALLMTTITNSNQKTKYSGSPRTINSKLRCFFIHNSKKTRVLIFLFQAKNFISLSCWHGLIGDIESHQSLCSVLLLKSMANKSLQNRCILTMTFFLTFHDFSWFFSDFLQFYLTFWLFFLLFCWLFDFFPWFFFKMQTRLFQVITCENFIEESCELFKIRDITLSRSPSL